MKYFITCLRDRFLKIVFILCLSLAFHEKMINQAQLSH